MAFEAKSLHWRSRPRTTPRRPRPPRKTQIVVQTQRRNKRPQSSSRRGEGTERSQAGGGRTFAGRSLPGRGGCGGQGGVRRGIGRHGRRRPVEACPIDWPDGPTPAGRFGDGLSDLARRGRPHHRRRAEGRVRDRRGRHRRQRSARSRPRRSRSWRRPPSNSARARPARSPRSCSASGATTTPPPATAALPARLTSKPSNFVGAGRRFLEKAAWQGARSRSTEEFIKQKQFARAAEELDAWQREFPAEKIDGYLTLLTARYWAGRGKYAQAIAQAEQLQAVNPDSPYVDQVLLLGRRQRDASRPAGIARWPRSIRC